MDMISIKNNTSKNRESDILRLYYALDTEPMSLSEIGEYLI